MALCGGIFRFAAYLIIAREKKRMVARKATMRVTVYVIKVSGGQSLRKGMTRMRLPTGRLADDLSSAGKRYNQRSRTKRRICRTAQYSDFSGTDTATAANGNCRGAFAWGEREKEVDEARIWEEERHVRLTGTVRKRHCRKPRPYWEFL